MTVWGVIVRGTVVVLTVDLDGLVLVDLEVFLAPELVGWSEGEVDTGVLVVSFCFSEPVLLLPEISELFWSDEPSELGESERVMMIDC